MELEQLSGVGKNVVESLIVAGYQSIKALTLTTADELSEIKGIGKKKADDIIKQAITLDGKKEE